MELADNMAQVILTSASKLLTLVFTHDLSTTALAAVLLD
jgi:hypothetical protein